MGKKKQRAKYISKGLRPAMSNALSKAVARDISIIDVELTKRKAWREGKNPWIVIDNPNPNETKARKIRVKAQQIWGDPRKNVYPPFKDKEARREAAA